MGRPTKFNRNDAIEIAMNTFWAKGYEPVSVSDLAAAMCITRSSFYNSFRNREAVFSEALGRYQSHGMNLEVSTDPDLCPMESVRSFFYRLCKKLAADPNARGCLIINCYAQASEDVPAPAGVQDFIDTKRQHFKLAADCVQQSGNIPAIQDTEAVASALIALLIGINILGKSERDAQTLWASADVTLTSLGFTPA